MLTNYESRQRVSGSIPVLPFKREAFTIKTMQQGPCIKTYQPKPGAKYICIAWGPPVPRTASFGYVFSKLSDFSYSKIDDYIGKKYTTSKVIKIPIYSRTRRCQKLRRDLSPSEYAKTACSKPIRYRTVVKQYERTYNAKESNIMLPVDHLSASRLCEGLGFEGSHNLDLYAYEVNHPPLEKYSAHVDEQYTNPIKSSFTNPGSVRTVVDTMTVYHAIARGLSKMNAFTTDTQTDLLANIAQAKQLLSLLSFVRLFPKTPLTAIAAGYLSYQFGFKPTLDDYFTMQNMSKKVAQARHNWNRDAGKIQYFHFTFLDTEFKSSVDLSYTYAKAKVDKKTKSFGKATVSLIGNKITIPDSVIKMSQMGLDKPLETLWELIPFSFILDWFTDVSGFISEIEKPVCPATFTVVDSCYSILDRLETHSYVTERRGLVYAGDIFCELKSYRRSKLNIDILNDVSLMGRIDHWEPTSRFGPHQAVLLGALAMVLNPSLRRL